MATVLGGTVAFLQKCCYKWRPGKWRGLDVANLILKNYFEKWRKILENHKIFLFFFSFSEKQFANSPTSCEIPPKNKTLRKLGKGRDLFFELFFWGEGWVARGRFRSFCEGGGAVVRLSFRLFFFFFFFVLRSSYKSLHEALVSGSRPQQQPSSLLLFSC
jgi:hypothetical protein